MLDHNLPPSWARGLHELSKNKFDVRVLEIVSLRVLFKPDVPDIEWLTTLGKQGDWIVISSDFFRKGKAERDVIRRYGLSVFVLGKAWHDKHPFWPRTAQMMYWWPRIVEQANTVSRAAFEVPWRTSGKFVQIAL